MTQLNIDTTNQNFWNELCGTQFAKQLGIHDFSKDSLAKYDKWYFDFYPYLKKYLDLIEAEGKTVCEIGLGYGTVSQFLAERSQNYFAVDIAKGPIEVVNQRLAYLNKPQTASIQTCHNLNFDAEFFDAVVAIGCFHHTGSVEKCIHEAYRVLKKGGRLLFMCYNKNSMRMLKKLPCDVFFNRNNPVKLNEKGCALYDVNSSGESAPYTELASKEYYISLCKMFSKVDITRENWEGRFRKMLLGNIAHLLGLDLYVLCKK